MPRVIQSGYLDEDTVSASVRDRQNSHPMTVHSSHFWSSDLAHSQNWNSSGWVIWFICHHQTKVGCGNGPSMQSHYYATTALGIMMRFLLFGQSRSR
jgi:hypothetical protein